MRYLLILLLFAGFAYWLIHAGLMPPKMVPSPLLEYMAENEQRQITEIRDEMRLLQEELNDLRRAESTPSGSTSTDLGKRMGNGDLRISLSDILKPGSTPSNASAEEKRIRKELRELSVKLDQHRAKLIWCQRGLVP